MVSLGLSIAFADKPGTLLERVALRLTFMRLA